MSRNREWSGPSAAAWPFVPGERAELAGGCRLPLFPTWAGALGWTHCPQAATSLRKPLLPLGDPEVQNLFLNLGRGFGIFSSSKFQPSVWVYFKFSGDSSEEKTQPLMRDWGFWDGLVIISPPEAQQL